MKHRIGSQLLLQDHAQGVMDDLFRELSKTEARSLQIISGKKAHFDA